MHSLMEKLKKFVESATGESLTTIDNESIEEGRARVEKKSGRPVEVVSRWPLVGRGNVMSSKLISHSEIERDLDRCLK